MRIIYVSHSFPLPGDPLSNIGGMQRVATALYRTLADRPDIEVQPLLLETSWKWTGVRTGPFLLRLVRVLPRLVQENRADVVLFSSMVTASVVGLVRDRIRRSGAITAAIPVGRDVTLPNPIYQRLVPKVFSSLDLVFPISRATADACLERGADPARVHVVPCGVDPPGGSQGVAKPDARQHLRSLLREHGHDLPDTALVLLSVGRHQERKGFHWFVDEVMPDLGDDVLYLIVGSGPMTSTIADRVQTRGLQKRVALLGQVPESVLNTLYAGADVFVMPNIPVEGDIEGFGVVMLEAGAAGLPVIAANLEGIQDVVEEGENGQLVATRDAKAFRRAIAGYHDRQLLAAASERARKHVEEHFGWPSVAEQYIQILRERL